MDDLELVRDLGRELEHDPPAALVRQRERLLSQGRRARPRGWTLLGAVAAVTAALVVVPVLLLRGGPGPERPAASPPAAGRALNLLVLGADARPGRPGRGRADTVLLVHLPADRRRPLAVSVPRDVMVRDPRCGDGAARCAELPIGQAYALGGRTGAHRAVEAAAGVEIDHAITLDLAGFERMVDALGGVEIVLPKAVDDPWAGLRLPAGRQVVDGRRALAYARARRGVGDGSDLDRIRRQQELMAALARRAEQVLADDPARLTAFARAAAGAVDSDLGARELLALLQSVRGADPDAVEFRTVPVGPYPGDVNRLALKPSADRLFARFRR